MKHWPECVWTTFFLDIYHFQQNVFISSRIASFQGLRTLDTLNKLSRRLHSSLSIYFDSRTKKHLKSMFRMCLQIPTSLSSEFIVSKSQNEDNFIYLRPKKHLDRLCELRTSHKHALKNLLLMNAECGSYRSHEMMQLVRLMCRMSEETFSEFW